MLPGIASGGVHAGEDLDERRLARAVLAEQRDDFAGANREIDTSSSARTPGKDFVSASATMTGRGANGSPASRGRRDRRTIVSHRYGQVRPLAAPHLQVGFLSGTFL